MTHPAEDDLLTTSGQRRLYGKLARNYDATTRAFYALGFPIERYRRRAVAALHVNAGDTVVELGCGTGGNFAALQAALGQNGRIIGVDLTPEMLEKARERVAPNGWTNVDLVESDMAAYAFPEVVDGVLSTFALMLSPAQDKVIAHGADALRRGGRLVVLDFKEPPWPEWVIRAYLPLVRAYGGTRSMGSRHPWEHIERALGNCLVREFYFGGVFLAVGEKRR